MLFLFGLPQFYYIFLPAWACLIFCAIIKVYYNDNWYFYYSSRFSDTSDWNLQKTAYVISNYIFFQEYWSISPYIFSWDGAFQKFWYIWVSYWLKCYHTSHLSTIQHILAKYWKRTIHQWNICATILRFVHTIFTSKLLLDILGNTSSAKPNHINCRQDVCEKYTSHFQSLGQNSACNTEI